MTANLLSVDGLAPPLKGAHLMPILPGDPTAAL